MSSACSLLSFWLNPCIQPIMLTSVLSNFTYCFHRLFSSTCSTTKPFVTSGTNFYRPDAFSVTQTTGSKHRALTLNTDNPLALFFRDMLPDSWQKALLPLWRLSKRELGITAICLVSGEMPVLSPNLVSQHWRKFHTASSTVYNYRKSTYEVHRQNVHGMPGDTKAAGLQGRDWRLLTPSTAICSDSCLPTMRPRIAGTNR